jgi:hypothetical protein
MLLPDFEQAICNVSQPFLSFQRYRLYLLRITHVDHFIYERFNSISAI